MVRAGRIATGLTALLAGLVACATAPEPLALKRPEVRGVTLPPTLIDEYGAPRLLALASLHAIRQAQGGAMGVCTIEGVPERALVDIQAAPLADGMTGHTEAWVFEYCERRIAVPVDVAYRPEAAAYVFDIRRGGTETTDQRLGDASIFGAE